MGLPPVGLRIVCGGSRRAIGLVLVHVMYLNRRKLGINISFLMPIGILRVEPFGGIAGGGIMAAFGVVSGRAFEGGRDHLLPIGEGIFYVPIGRIVN